MACYHPMKVWPLYEQPNGKIKYKFTSYDIECVELTRRNDVVCYSSSDVKPTLSTKKIIKEFIEVPCGKCIGCRLESSRQWANRCLLELEYHKSAYFVTLTYNNDFVPISYYLDKKTGEALQSLTLRKKDVQLFMKRLRKRFSDQKIRFFGCGEYGPSTFRPHYHLILFGLSLDDLVPFGRGEHGFQYYTSDSISKCWSHFDEEKQVFIPMGHCCVANVSWETCAYTARYVTKKLNGAESVFYSDFNIEPPFSAMSRKPGIAYQWYVDHPDMRDYEYINISTPKGGRKFRPPRYYDKLFDLDCPEESKKIKEMRKKMSEESKKIKLSKTSLSYLEMLEVEERNKLEQVKKLKRRDLNEKTGTA